MTSQTLRLDQAVRPARAPESVLVLEKAPEQPYSVIARVESKAGNVFKDFDDLRLIAIIEQADVVRRMRQHLREATEVPGARPSSGVGLHGSVAVVRGPADWYDRHDQSADGFSC